MKYRNGASNIGVACGFAAFDGEGRIRVHQNACREMGLPMELGAGVRGPSFPYEPVTVVYRLEPTETESPRLVALHVMRMARSMLPKTFYWNSQDWPLNLDFYPFRQDKAGTLTDDLLACLADEHDMPEWLHQACDDDDSLAELLEAAHSKKQLTNRLIVTGYVVPDRIVPVPREVASHDYLRVLLLQPGDADTIGLRMPPGTQGYNYMANGRCPADGIPVTVIGKLLVEIQREGEQVTKATTDVLMLEMNAVQPWDLMDEALPAEA